MLPAQSPHNADPHDYGAEKYAPDCQPLIAKFGIFHKEAMQWLLKIWTAQNQPECQDWIACQHVEAEEARQEQEQLLRQWEDANHLRFQEEEAACQEERKKNHNKFLPFNNIKLALTISIMPSPHTLCKLYKGEYIELHYFSNKGLAEAQSISHSVDDDAPALLQDKQGLHLFVPIAVAKAKETVIPDHKLTWSQIDEAMHQLLQAMKECGWEEDHVGAHLQFWMSLSAHKWQHNPKYSTCQVLIVYQATYQRRWHDTLGTMSSFNLKYLDEEALIKIKFKIANKLHTAITNQAREVSTLFHYLTFTCISPCKMHYTSHSMKNFSFPYSIGLHTNNNGPWCGPTTWPIGTWHCTHNTASTWVHTPIYAYM
ncbi:hypothetical protein PAXRUDRAFT_143871 [Paxillus rubicundulus Ve08.2h10]|uniref:Uncharacterized protein n=1 Tax=Paxillus rubicundulus Ve08.2h10 TaxID=930991 RepID=A0A0D0DW51_9AGAM|nr:hypothetical protein PAXRUDRAFT_143871 [Paxillus rubicundulus Ve08.2h10]